MERDWEDTGFLGAISLEMETRPQVSSYTDGEDILLLHTETTEKDKKINVRHFGEQYGYIENHICELWSLIYARNITAYKMGRVAIKQ